MQVAVRVRVRVPVPAPEPKLEPEHVRVCVRCQKSMNCGTWRIHDIG